jgi:hypothetical protein
MDVQIRAGTLEVLLGPLGVALELCERWQWRASSGGFKRPKGSGHVGGDGMPENGPFGMSGSVGGLGLRGSSGDAIWSVVNNLRFPVLPWV